MSGPPPAAESAYLAALEVHWHAVLRSQDVGDEPRAVTLLGRPLVVARINGLLACLDDTCRHLGAALALGEVVEGGLRCRYHGWTYDESGRCVDIPARRGAAIPREARVASHPVHDRQGLIWVRLSAGPAPPPPSYPEWGAAGFRATPPRAYAPWAASAPRIVMAGLDDTHFAWVHPGLLGDPGHPEPPDHQVRREGGQLVSTYVHAQPANQSIGGAAGEMEEVTYTNRCTPTTIHLLKRGPAGSYAIFMAMCPHSATSTSVFLSTARDFDLDPSRDGHYLEFEDRIQAQDRAVVESQRPWLLPPLSSRLMLYVRPADLPLIAFQRWMEELGVPQV
ncbi:MAG: Rieske 2Fe-2S domain-containing protein [Candidatus Dormibacterales bacterium]